MTDPAICEVEAKAGRGAPFPEWAALMLEAQEWGVSPMEYREWPLEDMLRWRLIRSAKAEAQQVVHARGNPNPSG